jgi:HEPN domain-containing protein
VSPDFQRQLDTATAFFLAGERCALELNFRAYGFHSISAPTIVNYAFAAELALKLIHSLAVGRPTSVHNLEELYGRLPMDVKTNLPHLSEHGPEIGRYFVDWRYPYEKDFLIGDHENVRRAFIECYREIRRLAPGMSSVYERQWGSFEPEWVQSWFHAQSRFELRAIV